jgi:broad specificity phosphatase PhoE
MKMIIIRHGEIDRTPCYERNFIGQGIELAPLTELGCKQAEDVAFDSRLNGSEIIVSSPYTRCMQTAAIISRIKDIPITVEIDLHEWLPDINFLNRQGEGEELCDDFKRNKGRWPKGETRRWETIDMIADRLIRTLNKYICYKKVVFVIHGMLMHQLNQYKNIPNCFVDEIHYDADFVCTDWCEIEPSKN